MTVPNPTALTPPGEVPVIVHLKPDLLHFQEWHEPRPRLISGVVLHSTMGRDSRRWLSTDPASSVSIHALGQPDGTRVNIVNYADVAWHVGEAVAPWTNATTLGYEFENRSNGGLIKEPYPAVQIATGAHWLATVMYSYGIPWERVVRHGDVARPVGRRIDPVEPFPWDAFRRITEQWLFYLQYCSADERTQAIK